MISHSTPHVRTFLSLALLSVFVMITLGMSPAWRAAIPALCVWTILAAGYGVHRMIHTWTSVRPAI